MTDKPLLLLDVDGPLNPYAAKATRRPDGYTTQHVHSGPDGCRWADKGIRVWLSPAHGPMLLALAGLVDLVWATAWEHSANTLIAPVIGLPELPVIEFPRRDSYPFGQIFKRDDVEAYVADRAFAWLDDDFEAGDLEWAKARAESGAATLLLHISPRIGIRQEDVNQVAEWAAQVRDAEPVGTAS
jgi:hypothetical protein